MVKHTRKVSILPRHFQICTVTSLYLEYTQYTYLTNEIEDGFDPKHSHYVFTHKWYCRD